MNDVENRTTKSQPTAQAEEDAKGTDQPSGFILKLFQMVHGAPDEVISWTPNGDAFIIGSDLTRLEFETLPQYFRHNRFQSLVRQLNFYSFRKINRERNVWVYKHQLFHRDHPEKLYLVRRRTCPGMDGRKQRISRVSSEKLSRTDGGSDDSSVEMPPLPIPQPSKVAKGKKRVLEDLLQNLGEASKRSRHWWNESNQDSHVDTSLIASMDAVNGEDIQYSTRKKRSDSVEQSLVVSEVASQLQKYARKSSKGGRSSKRSGIVTPPFQASSLLTYDDEFMVNESIEDSFTLAARRISLEGSSEVGEGIKDSRKAESSVTVESRDVVPRVTPLKADAPVMSAPPVPDCDTVESVLQRMMFSLEETVKATFISDAALVGFCMSNDPNGDDTLCEKITQLLSSCGSLEADFKLYRSALHPHHGAPEEGDGLLLWKSLGSRSAALHDFKTFAFNCVQNVLGKDGSVLSLPVADKGILVKTAAIWRLSM